MSEKVEKVVAFIQRNCCLSNRVFFAFCRQNNYWIIKPRFRHFLMTRLFSRAFSYALAGAIVLRLHIFLYILALSLRDM